MREFNHTQKQRDAMETLFERYLDIISENAHTLEALPIKCRSGNLKALCKEATENSGKYPFDKLNRWMGFIQGVLATTGSIDMNDEREITRPILHSFHDHRPESFSGSEDQQ